MNKYTPGPWHVTYCGFSLDDMTTAVYGIGGTVWNEGKGYGHIVAECLGRFDDPTCCDGEANAKLIAAAPDLLEALETWYAWSRDMPTDIEAMVRAAIAKATK